jgi:hypothetical protein
MWVGLEEGIAYGVICSVLYFAYEYATATVGALNNVPVSGGCKHDYTHQAVLDTMMPRRVVALAPQG